MSNPVKKLWNDYGIIGVLIFIGVAYALFLLYNRMSRKGVFETESMSHNRNKAYNNTTSGVPQPALEDEHGDFAPASGSSQGIAVPPSCRNGQNPSDLLPKDKNSEWSQLNPSGQGDLQNINLLKAGYHIGIDTIGQSLRNANQQIRSEPPNPQVNVGPWNLSPIEPDFMRPPLELGQGGQ